MHVFGDVHRTENADELIHEIRLRLQQCEGMGAGLERHQTLVAAFIRCSELAQGVADAERDLIDADDVTEKQDAATELLLNLAKAIVVSWESGFTAALNLPEPEKLLSLSASGQTRTKEAEGYAFYALYPEAFIEAARMSGLGPQTTVIGIRSIGMGLAALVAAAIGASAAVSIRPTGHPFNRQMIVGGLLATRLLAGAADYAIVDEGPGLSGSSFNCVADWLVAHGVGEDRIRFFPSHSGELGPLAQPRHRERWSKAHKYVVDFDEVLLKSVDPARRVQSWIADALGPNAGDFSDLSGGAWRALHYPERNKWPPADPAMEKRKFLVHADGRSFLAKFAGLGARGERALELSHQIARAGFAPAPVALRHGFLLAPWIKAVPKPETRPPVEVVLRYLEFRATLPPSVPGATPADLFAMATYNIGLRSGPVTGDAVRLALGNPELFFPLPCRTDNRMHCWEWIYSASGWQKLDGTDHHAAHDFIGCQDVAWDLVGAAVELNWSETQRQTSRQDLSARLGRGLNPAFLEAMELCYLGFQIGLWTMVAERNSTEDARRIEHQLSLYENRVQTMLNRAPAVW